jgi:hypothetical protein
LGDKAEEAPDLSIGLWLSLGLLEAKPEAQTTVDYGPDQSWHRRCLMSFPSKPINLLF